VFGQITKFTGEREIFFQALSTDYFFAMRTNRELPRRGICALSQTDMVPGDLPALAQRQTWTARKNETSYGKDVSQAAAP